MSKNMMEISGDDAERLRQALGLPAHARLTLHSAAETKKETPSPRANTSFTTSWGTTNRNASPNGQGV